MKVRTGFVSNSSSASFCIGKVYMTEQQIEEFSNFCKHQVTLWDDYINETNYYFYGEIEQANWEPIRDKLVALGVDKKYIG